MKIIKFLLPLLFLMSCSKNDVKDSKSSTSNANPLVPTPAGPDHIFVVFLENHSYDDIVGNNSADYLNSLIDNGYLFKNMHAHAHPSQPNYIEFFAGDSLGIHTDNCISPKLTAPNLYSELNTVSKTAASYCEDLPTNLTKCKSGDYARKHNAFSDFTNVPDAANKSFDVFPSVSGYSSLENLVYIIPNLKDDMHTGTSDNRKIQNGDNWVHDNLDSLAQWCKTNNSMFIVTWDEDDKTPGAGNHIPCIVYGQYVNTGSDSVFYDHYSVSKAICSFFGTSTTWTTNITNSPTITGWTSY